MDTTQRCSHGVRYSAWCGGCDDIAKGRTTEVDTTVPNGICLSSPDQTHCEHWWDSQPCHYCSDNTPDPLDDSTNESETPAMGATRLDSGGMRYLEGQEDD